MYLVLLSATVSGLAVLLGRKWLAYRKEVAQFNNHPGLRVLAGPFSMMGNLLPRIPYVSIGMLNHFTWWSKRYIFDLVGVDVYTLVSLFPLSSMYLVSDPDLIKEIVSPKSAFTKDTQIFAAFKVFGDNLLNTEGETWRRQRRVCAPAFSETIAIINTNGPGVQRNNKLVWSTAMSYVDEIMDVWSSRDTIRVHDVYQELTTMLALCIISKAGYGQDVRWKDNDPIPVGHELTFKQALLTVSEYIHLPIILPDWAWGFKKSWIYAKKANNEMKMYFHEMIASRRELQDMAERSLVDNKHDILNQLVHAYDEKNSLSDEELMAGHDTTANTLAVALALLALYPDEQARLTKEIDDIQTDRRDPTYEDMPKVPYALAVLYESLRLYPMVPYIPKQAVSDTTFTIRSHFDQPTIKLNVPRYSQIGLLPTGVHYNPKYWDDPLEFVPSRFIDSNWNRSAFIPFSVGARSCIGRRFAETSIVAVLVRLLSKYSVSVDETKFKANPGESAVDRRERFLNLKFHLTPTPKNVALVFTRRERVDT